MGDLETSNSAARTASVSSLASGKLRALADVGGRFGETEPLVDAFAEVFARMAIAIPTPAPVPSETDSRAEQPEPAESDPTTDSADRAAADGRDQPQLVPTRQHDGAQQVLPQQPPAGRETAGQPKSTTDSVTTDDHAANSASPDSEPGNVNSIQPPADDDAHVDPSSSIVGHQTAESIKSLESAPLAAANSESSAARKGESNATSRTDVGTNIPATGRLDQTGETSDPTLREDQTVSSERSPSKAEQSQADPLPARNKRQQRLHENRESPPNQTSSGRADQQGSETFQNANSTVAAGNPEPAETFPQRAEPRPESTIARPVSTVVDGLSSAPIKSNPVATSGNRVESRGTANSLQSSELNRIDPGQRRETANTKQTATDTTARVKLVQRVSRAFQHLGPDGGMVRLRLAPAELGSVRLEMRVEKQSVRARVITETEAASATLREHLPDLKARLESFGMQVEQIEVETEANNEQSGLPFDRESQQRENHQRPGQQTQASVSQEASASESKSVFDSGQPLRVALASQGVDLRV